jgi:hypothetical protein
MIHYDFLILAILIFLYFCWEGFLRAAKKEWTKKPFVDLNSKCPACGHHGCTLEFRAPQPYEFGDKKEIKQTEPCVIRKCTTCGAPALQKTVLDPKEWIAK